MSMKYSLIEIYVDLHQDSYHWRINHIKRLKCRDLLPFSHWSIKGQLIFPCSWVGMGGNNARYCFLSFFYRKLRRLTSAPCATLLYKCQTWLTTKTARAWWSSSALEPVWHRTNCGLQSYTSFKVVNSRFVCLYVCFLNCSAHFVCLKSCSYFSLLPFLLV